MTGRVCIDASISLAVVLPDPRRNLAISLLDRWLYDGTKLVAPPLYYAEVTSVIRLGSHRGLMTTAEAHDALASLLESPVDVWSDVRALQDHALRLATRFNQPRAYDAQYLAVADLLGCELWTADRRLVNAVSRHLPWVHYVEEAA